jgi:hypothetical protein
MRGIANRALVFGELIVEQERVIPTELGGHGQGLRIIPDSVRRASRQFRGSGISRGRCRPWPLAQKEG